MMQFRKEMAVFCGIALLTGYSLAQKQQLQPREK
jgi:hypothetical protein